jgi:hypothetical protein
MVGLLLSSLGLATTVTFGLLVSGNITPTQVADLLTQALVYVHLYLSGLGIAAGGLTIRAAVPHMLRGTKNWFVNLLDDRIKSVFNAPVEESQVFTGQSKK